MGKHLQERGVRFLDYEKEYANALRLEVAGRVKAVAVEEGLAVIQVNASQRKEALVEKRGRKAGIVCIVCILGAMERCRCYKVLGRADEILERSGAGEEIFGGEQGGIPWEGGGGGSGGEGGVADAAYGEKPDRIESDVTEVFDGGGLPRDEPVSCGECAGEGFLRAGEAGGHGSESAGQEPDKRV
jgi:hypothetical protein